MGEEESVKVAVRVRPFNKRERNRNATCIIEMTGETTKIFNPDEPSEEKTFTFDYSYWSHDDAEETADGYFQSKPGGRYIGQKDVFGDLGIGILKNAWQGYNTSLFAYGQTGSGKSWSVVGYGVNKGIVPLFCETIFNEIKGKKDAGDETEFEVVFSMLEIYNEKVCDLLDDDSSKNILRIRQHPKRGFYAAGLSSFPVKSYKEIESKMAVGTKNRTVASTNMNATSSRAHTIVGVTFKQKAKNAAGEVAEKSSIINLVDLAGSERADSTGATGERLKEGAAINQSLSSLGNCIAALAERSEGKKVRVPFRDSVLTKLLKNALGGNSKTIMIAALSPADINYEETLSTLRYADRAKQIKTKAVVNEDPVEKLIRQLKEENEKLKAKLQEDLRKNPMQDDESDDEDDDVTRQGLTEEEIEKMKSEWLEDMKMSMASNDKEMEDMKRSYEEKLAEAEKNNAMAVEREEKFELAKQSTPHLSNLNHDPQLSGRIVHLLEKETILVGSKANDELPDVVLPGFNIKNRHGEIHSNGTAFSIKPLNDARILVNGEPLDNQVELKHNDRILFGTNNLYLFNDPMFVQDMKEKNVQIENITYEDAQEEIARSSGVNLSPSRQGNGLNDSLVELLPAVNDANGMSEELDKKVFFELIVMPTNSELKLQGFDKVFIKVTHLLTGHMWFWSKEKFINRKFAMDEVYEYYKQQKDSIFLNDPFIESPDTETIIGICELYVSNVAYMMAVETKAAIIDYRSVKIGELEVDLVPINTIDDEADHQNHVIDSPYELEGRNISFNIAIGRAKKLPKRYIDVYCKYRAFSHKDVHSNVSCDETKFAFEQQHTISLQNLSRKMIDMMMKEPVIIEIWGKQKKDRLKPVNNAAKMGRSTAEIMKLEAMRKSLGQKNSKKSHVSLALVKREAEFIILQKRMELLEKKLMSVVELCNRQEENGESSVAVAEVQNLLKLSTNTLSKKKSRHSVSSSSSSSSESDSEKSEEQKREKKKRHKKEKSKINCDENHNESKPQELKIARQYQSKSSFCVIM